MEKCWVYVIQSEKHGWTYTGHTKDVQKRLLEHNRGKMNATRHYRPFKLIYTEEFTSRSDAMQKEKFLKSGKGREIRKAIIKQRKHIGSKYYFETFFCLNL